MPGKHRPLRPWQWGVVVAVVVTGAYSWLSVRQWTLIDVPSWDLGIFTQLASAYSHAAAPIVPIKGPGYMLLGDHFHPILVLLGPVFWLFPSGLTLLIVQNVLFGVSAAILTAAAVRLLGRAGVAIGLAYGLSWGLQSAAASQFHEIAFALPLLVASLVAIIDHRWWTAALVAAPLVLVKEDLGLTLAAIGVVIALRASGRARWIGAGTAAFGLAAFWVTTALILPALNGDGQWAYAEDSLLGMLRSGDTSLTQTLVTGFAPKAVLVFLVAAITCFLCAGSTIALVTVPTFAWRLTSQVEAHWSTNWHYDAVLMAIVFGALVDFLARRTREHGPAVPAPARPGDIRIVGRLRLPVAAVPLATAAIALGLIPWFGLAALAEAPTAQDRARAAAAREAFAVVPDGATVVSDITPMAYLAPRAEVMWLGNDNPAPDLIFFDSASGVWGDHVLDPVEFGRDHFGLEYALVFDSDGFLIAERADHLTHPRRE